MKYFCKMFVLEKYLCVYVVGFQHVTQNNRGGEGSLWPLFCVVQTPIFRKKKFLTSNFKKEKFLKEKKEKNRKKILKKGKKLLSLHYLLILNIYILVRCRCETVVHFCYV